MKSLLVVLSLVFIATSALASCTEDYVEAINAIKAKDRKSAIQSVALTIGTIVFPPSGLTAIAIHGIKSKVTYDQVKHFISKEELEDVKEVLEDADAGYGNALSEVHDLIKVENPDITQEQLADSIRMHNNQGFFCGEGMILASFKDLLVMEGASYEFAENQVGFLNENKIKKRAKQSERPTYIPGHKS